MWQSLHDAWWRLATQSQPRSFPDAFASSALAVGSAAYRAAAALRNTAYDRGWIRQVRLPCRVVSIGNLTVGGTGKTACVELIAKKLQSRGRRVAVLSRGYGGQARSNYWLRYDAGQLMVGDTVGWDGDPSTRPSASLRTAPVGLAMGRRGLADEPQLLARHLDGVPVVIGPRREQTGRLACEQFGAQALVLDDGFQHRRVARDCDIVLVSARMPLGGWACLPRGPMREPLKALARADVIILTKADEALSMLGAWQEQVRSYNPDAAVVTAAHTPATLMDGATGRMEDLKRLEGLHVGLVSSIGDPQGFEATIQRLHATVSWHRAYPDHHPYQPRDWADLARRKQGTRPEAIITTEKDWVRLRPVMGAGPLDVPLWVLGVRMTILNGEDALDARLAALNTR